MAAGNICAPTTRRSSFFPLFTLRRYTPNCHLHYRFADIYHWFPPFLAKLWTRSILHPTLFLLALRIRDHERTYGGSTVSWLVICIHYLTKYWPYHHRMTTNSIHYIKLINHWYLPQWPIDSPSLPHTYIPSTAIPDRYNLHLPTIISDAYQHLGHSTFLSLSPFPRLLVHTWTRLVTISLLETVQP